jgi:plastocyanin/uncharacterized membrane protein
MQLQLLKLSKRGIRLVLGTSAVSLSLLLLSLALAGETLQFTERATRTIVMQQMRFNPAEIKVNAGDTVEWKNQDIYSHTVTSDDGSFDSGLIAPGQSWETTVKAGGTIAYHCRPHPNMAATLIVSSAAGASPQGTSTRNGNDNTQSIKLRLPTSPEEFHPIFVNFTAALLPLALLSDVLGLLFRRQSLHSAGWWMTFYEALITPFTVAAGWWWKHMAGPHLPPKIISVHQWLGTSAALLFFALAYWRWRSYKAGRPPSFAYLAFAIVAAVALVYQGSLGGAMLFGK